MRVGEGCRLTLVPSIMDVPPDAEPGLGLGPVLVLVNDSVAEILAGNGPLPLPALPNTNRARLLQSRR